MSLKYNVYDFDKMKNSRHNIIDITIHNNTAISISLHHSPYIIKQISRHWNYEAR